MHAFAHIVADVYEAFCLVSCDCMCLQHDHAAGHDPLWRVVHRLRESLPGALVLLCCVLCNDRYQIYTMGLPNPAVSSMVDAVELC